MNPEHVASPATAAHETEVKEGHLPDTAAERIQKLLTLATSSAANRTSDETPTPHESSRKEVACQTDPVSEVSYFTSPAMNGSVAKLENRATQTEPATRSVFTRSSRFLPGPSENVLERPHTTSMAPSHRGDSTAVLSR